MSSSNWRTRKTARRTSNSPESLAAFSCSEGSRRSSRFFAGFDRWVVDGLVSADAVSSVPMGVTAALTFAPGRVDVEAGCNQGGGAVTVTATTLTFGPLALTKMACEGGAMEVERAVMAALSGEVRYVIEADKLTLSGGTAGLMLRAAP